MGRLLIGGALLFVCGPLFIIRGIAAGNWAEVGFGVPGLSIGIGALIVFKLERRGRTPRSPRWL